MRYDLPPQICRDSPEVTIEVIDRSPKFGSTLAEVTLSRCGRSEPPRAVRGSRVSQACLKHALSVRYTPCPPPIVSYGPLTVRTTTDSASIGAPRRFGWEGRSPPKMRSCKTGSCGQEAMPSRFRCTDPSCAKLMESIKREIL